MDILCPVKIRGIMKYKDLINFEETIMRYLLFLVHVQQSLKIPLMEKIKIFDRMKDISGMLFSNVQSYMVDKNEYNTFDKNEILIHAMDEVVKSIDRDIIHYNKEITLVNNDFSFYKIISTLTDMKYDVKLTYNNISQLLYFNELTRDEENKKKKMLREKELENVRNKNEKGLKEIIQKTFLNMLRGNNNKRPLRFFEVNEYILKNYDKKDITYVQEQPADSAEGIFFIETRDDRKIILNFTGRKIEYCFRFINSKDTFVIYIQGIIKINDTEEDFYINEQYSNSQFENVINSYNLKRTIELFNDLGKKENKEETVSSPNDIDNFLSGRIV